MNETQARSKTKLPVNHTAVSKVENYPILYVVGLVIGLLLFVISLAVAHAHSLTGFQAQVFHFVNNFSDRLKLPALWLSEGLGAAYPITVCLFVPLAFKLYRLSWRFAVTVGGTLVAMELGKLVAKEPRPVALLHGTNIHVRAIETGLTSYPSGHEAVATAMALTLWLILPKRWRWVSILWIAVVAVSRVYLGVHTPNDVVGGFAMGLICVCIVRLLPHNFAKALHLDLDRPLTEPGF